MRRLLLAFSIVVSLAAQAAERSYAVLSLVGDRLLVSQYNIATGSRLDRNTRQYIAMPDDSLDRAVLRAVKAQIAGIDAGARVEVLGLKDASFHSAANDALEKGGVASLLPLISTQLREVGASHWLVVTKHRADARAKLVSSTIGSGFLEGLGFYVDAVKRVRNVNTGEVATGLVTPFAYLRFTLVDAATGTIVREEVTTVSSVMAKASATHPWDALTGEQKVRALEQLIRRAADQAIPALLAP